MDSSDIVRCPCRNEYRYRAKKGEDPNVVKTYRRNPSFSLSIHIIKSSKSKSQNDRATVRCHKKVKNCWQIDFANLLELISVQSILNNVIKYNRKAETEITNEKAVY